MLNGNHILWFLKTDIIPETNKYYKFGITVPGEEPVSEINVKNNWKSLILKQNIHLMVVLQISVQVMLIKDIRRAWNNSNSNKEIKNKSDAGFKLQKSFS